MSQPMTDHRGLEKLDTINHCEQTCSGLDTLAIDFVNTVPCEVCQVPDGLSSAAEVRRWLDMHRDATGSVQSRVSLKRLLRFRKTVRKLFHAAVNDETPRANEIKALNQASALTLTCTHLELEWKREGRFVREVSRTVPATDFLLAGIAMSAMMILCEPTRGKLRRCEGSHCAHFLVVTNPKKHHCSPTGCGNRARVARHYERIRSSLESA